MVNENTTIAVQRFLDGMSQDTPDEPAIRALLERAVSRLGLLSANLLYRSYPRLTRPPLNLNSDELLGGVVERLLKALRGCQPKTVREFFGLANQHIRWELNDSARRLDKEAQAAEYSEQVPACADSTGTGLSADARRMLAAIENLPDEQREAFELVRIQGLTQFEAAEMLGVASKTVQRRLNRALVLLSQELDDLNRPPRAAIQQALETPT